MKNLDDGSKALCYLAGLSGAVRIEGGSFQVSKLGEELQDALFAVAKMGYPTNQVERLGRVTAELLRAAGVNLGKGEVPQASVAEAVRRAARSILP